MMINRSKVSACECLFAIIRLKYNIVFGMLEKFNKKNTLKNKNRYKIL